MRLTERERCIIESIVTISKEDICLKELAYRLHISYEVLNRHRINAMRKNGYTSWEGFLCDFVREEEEK